MVQSKVDSQGNGISGGSFSYVGKLIWSNGWREACLRMIQDQFFNALHNNESKSNWPVVVQVCRICRTRMMVADFKQCGIVASDREMLKMKTPAS